MCRLDQLPTEAFAQICQNLPNIKDIFSFQSTNRRIRQQVSRSFWSRPRRLQISDGANTFLFLESGQMLPMPSSIESIHSVCLYARNLTHFDLSSNCHLENEKFLVNVVEIIRANVRVVNSLYLSYYNPEFMYAAKSHRNQNVEDNLEQEASPSLSTHKKICKLIAKQKENLKLLHIRMNSTGFLAIGRHRENELHVEFDYECTQSVMLMLHQLFAGYTSNNQRRTQIFRLGLNFTDAEKLKHALIFITHAAFPCGQKTNSLKEIHCRVPEESLISSFDFNELRAELRSTLTKIVWHIEDFKNSTPTQIRTLICEIRLPKQKEYTEKAQKRRNLAMVSQLPSLFAVDKTQRPLAQIRCVV